VQNCHGLSNTGLRAGASAAISVGESLGGWTSAGVPLSVLLWHAPLPVLTYDFVAAWDAFLAGDPPRLRRAERLRLFSVHLLLRRLTSRLPMPVTSHTS